MPPSRWPCIHHARCRGDTIPTGRAAAFTFFFHFPVMMLLVAAGATLLGHPLMQQPAAARYGEFVAVVAACVGMTALVTRAVATV